MCQKVDVFFDWHRKIGLNRVARFVATLLLCHRTSRTIYRESRVPELLSQAKVYAIADEIYGDDLPFIVSARNTAELPASSVFTRIAEDLHSHRAAVEHFNARLHKWGILDCRIFRQHPDRFQIFYRVCVQLEEGPDFSPRALFFTQEKNNKKMFPKQKARSMSNHFYFLLQHTITCT